MTYWLEVGRRYCDENYNVQFHNEVQKCRRAALALCLPWDEVTSKTRTQPLCDFRFIAMKHLRDKGFNYRMIGEVFGKRDHSTAVYAVRTANNLLTTDRNFKRKYTIFKQS